MATGFDHEQFTQDMKDLKTFFAGFFKSMGFASKKAEVGGGPTLGFWEERYIRFRLNLVEMGISKVIRTVILILVTVVIFIPLFLDSDTVMKIIIAFIFLSFYTWLFMDHLVVDKKPVGAIAALLVKIQDTRVAGGEAIRGGVTSVGQSLQPSPKAPKKDAPAPAAKPASAAPATPSAAPKP